MIDVKVVRIPNAVRAPIVGLRTIGESHLIHALKVPSPSQSFRSGQAIYIINPYGES